MVVAIMVGDTAEVTLPVTPRDMEADIRHKAGTAAGITVIADIPQDIPAFRTAWPSIQRRTTPTTGVTVIPTAISTDLAKAILTTPTTGIRGIIMVGGTDTGTDLVTGTDWVTGAELETRSSLPASWRRGTTIHLGTT